ncbi:MAG: menaquinone biosynthesis protein [Nitrospirae bacterium]|nr:menaquinone biosynthesis protein [Nitrospirota bacterium]
MKIGRINFANLYPIFHCLEKAYQDADVFADITTDLRYEFISGVPSQVNALIREGSIDISPSSSIEYLRNPGKYYLIDGHSISSIGPIMSIVLFSKVSIERLDGTTVLASFQSETSTALLKIILGKFYGLSADVRVSGATLKDGLAEHAAYMLIGDSAMYEAQRASLQPGTTPYLYDLGAIWYEHTGLPFVFALWIAKRDCNAADVERFTKDLDWAKAEATSSFDIIAENSPYAEIFSTETLVKYWKTISYCLTGRHKDGLNLFESYLRELHLI